MTRERANGEQICCPHCLTEYNLSDAKPDYIHIIKCFDEIFYVALCSDCLRLIQTHKKMEKKHTVHRISLNIFSNPNKWLSATTEVAMIVHNQNFSEALLQGHGLTREAYDAVKVGNYLKLPFEDLGIILSWD